MTFDWTPEKIETLRHLWSEGRTRAEIAAHFGDGCTTHMVRWRLRRLGLEKSPTREPAPSAKSSKVTDRGGGVLQRIRNKHAGPSKPRPMLVDYRRSPSITPDPITIPTNVKANQPPSLNLEILQLTRWTCKWPHGDRAPYLFCGSPTSDGTPYCRHHTGRAFNFVIPSSLRRLRTNDTSVRAAKPNEQIQPLDFGDAA